MPAEVRPARSAARFGWRAVALGLVLTVAAASFGLLLFAVQDAWGPLLRLDEDARDGLHRVALANAGAVTVLEVLSVIGSAVVYVPLFAGVAVHLGRQGRRRAAVFVAVVTIGSTLLNLLVKEVVHRARPVLDDPVASAAGLSFPSGHAQSAIVAVSVLVLAFSVRRPAALVAGAAFVLAVGVARVGLGVHYVSDVLAGYVLGAAWVAGTYGLLLGFTVRSPAARSSARTAPRGR